MTPILRAHPDDPTKAELVIGEDVYTLSTAKCVQWMDVLNGPVLQAALEHHRSKNTGYTHIEGWGIFQ